MFPVSPGPVLAPPPSTHSSNEQDTSLLPSFPGRNFCRHFSASFFVSTFNPHGRCVARLLRESLHVFIPFVLASSLISTELGLFPAENGAGWPPPPTFSRRPSLRFLASLIEHCRKICVVPSCNTSHLYCRRRLKPLLRR